MSIAGTYRIVLCKTGECAVGDTSRAVVWGELVLTDSVLADSVRQQFPQSFLTRTPNGCYALRRRRPERSLAGLESEALTFWEKDAGQVSFALYQSPDAGHGVRVVVRGDTLHGTGTSWGISNIDTFPTDFVRAIRIGPADIRRCHAAKPRAGDD